MTPLVARAMSGAGSLAWEQRSIAGGGSVTLRAFMSCTATPYPPHQISVFAYLSPLVIGETTLLA